MQELAISRHKPLPPNFADSLHPLLLDVRFTCTNYLVEAHVIIDVGHLAFLRCGRLVHGVQEGRCASDNNSVQKNTWAVLMAVFDVFGLNWPVTHGVGGAITCSYTETCSFKGHSLLVANTRHTWTEKYNGKSTLAARRIFISQKPTCNQYQSRERALHSILRTEIVA